MKKFTKANYSDKLSGDTSINSYYLKEMFLKVGLAVYFITVLFAGCKKASSLTEHSKLPGAAGSTSIINTATGDEFSIVVLPDTQWYMMGRSTLIDGGGTNHPPGDSTMFYAQIDWIKANQAAENIVYVAGLGDIVDGGDQSTYHDVGHPNTREWNNAKYYYNLETPFSGHPYGIPYGLAVGNHDQTIHGWALTSAPYPGANDSTTMLYNQYFGVSHFAGKSYYKGSYTAIEGIHNNDSHYDYFTAGGKNFIVIYLEYDEEHDQFGTGLANWAYGLLAADTSRKGIIVMHALTVPNPTAHTNYDAKPAIYSGAQMIYNKIKTLPNVFLMLGGHTGSYPADGTEGVEGEGYRQDTYNGHTIRMVTSNYQWRPLSGDGYMRVMKFSVINDQITIKTYSPYRENHSQTPFYETDGDSQFNTSMFREVTASKTNDYVGGGKSQLTVYYSGVWKFIGKADNTYGAATTDIPVPGDYDGNGITEQAYWRSTTDYQWYLPTMANLTWGTTGDIPVCGDYDGDGRTDVAVWRPSNFKWYIYPDAAGAVAYGTTGDIPVPGDYDGDGKVDLAVWRPSTGEWYIHNVEDISWGQTGDIPTPGDYNGDGHIDYSVFRPSTHVWYIKDQITHVALPSYTLTNYVAGDIPVPGDYDGDGKTDPALYRPSTGQLFVKNILTATITGSTSSYKPVNLPYSIRQAFSGFH